MTKNHSDEAKRLLIPIINSSTRRYLQKFSSPQSLALEIGCGPGQYRFAVRGNYIGFDLTTQDYRRGLPRFVDLLADARALPFREKCFDLVFYSNIFHYFDNGAKLLNQAISLLKSKGYLLIFDYSKTTLDRLALEYKKSSSGFYAIPRTTANWINLLQDAGLDDVRLEAGSPWKQVRYILYAMIGGEMFANNWLDEQPAAIVAFGRKG